MEQAIGRLWMLAPVGFVSFLVSLQLIVLLRPWLARHALAHPNARSSHHAPTPQGGGIAVIAATVAVSLGRRRAGAGPRRGSQGPVAGDDRSRDPPHRGRRYRRSCSRSRPRRAWRCSASPSVRSLQRCPRDWHILPHLPWWVERGCLFFGGLWFVNLVNFMDGIDWMTVAEFVPAVGAITLFGLIGKVESAADAAGRRAAGRHSRLCTVQQAGGPAVSG